MRLPVIIAALTVSACTTTPAMQTALAPLAGQPVQLAFERLGPPSASTPVGADTVYEWYSTRMVHAAPQSPTVSGAPAYAGPGVPYTCHVRIVADGEGRIRDSQFGEETGGCRETARSLSQLAYSEPQWRSPSQP